jgi:hypothetical protein
MCCLEPLLCFYQIQKLVISFNYITLEKLGHLTSPSSVSVPEAKAANLLMLSKVLAVSKTLPKCTVPSAEKRSQLHSCQVCRVFFRIYQKNENIFRVTTSNEGNPLEILPSRS